MRPQPLPLQDALRSLWLRPTLAVIGALTLGVVLSSIEVSPDSWLGSVVFDGSAEDARGLLTVVVGTMITVTSLVFALTVVVLQIASTQFSPRLLRWFLRDPGTQMVLSTFVGTVAYSLAGLHTVGRAINGEALFVPRLAVTGALTLALISVGMLVYYIQHITDAIRIDTIMRSVERGSLHVLARDHPVLHDNLSEDGDSSDSAEEVEREDTAPVPSKRPGATAARLSARSEMLGDVMDGGPGDDLEVPVEAEVIPARVSGYLEAVRGHTLLGVAERHGFVVRFIPHVGKFVVAGEPLAYVWRPDGGRVDLGAVFEGFRRTVELSRDRWAEQEVGVALRQMVDIANRAAASSIQDVYTAVQAVHHLSVVLADAVDRSFAPRTWSDASGQVRVYLPLMSFVTHLNVVVDSIRQGGGDRHPRIAIELLRMLELIGKRAPSEAIRDAVATHIDVVVSHAELNTAHEHDRAQVRRIGERVRANLDEAWKAD